MVKTLPTPTPRLTPVPRLALLLLAAVWAVLAVSTVPGVRSQPGYVPLWDVWVQLGGYVLTAGIAGLRALTVASHRAIWALVAAALALRAFAFVYTITVLSRPPPYPSLADACWVLSGLLLVVALGLIARVHLPRRSRTLVLDALLGGLAAAAVALALFYPTQLALTRPGIPRDVVATNIAYPLIDVVQLVIIAGLLSATQWRLGPSARCISIGIVVMAAVDGVFLYLAAVGLFRPGTVIAPLSLGGTALVALAAWLPDRASRRPPPEGAAGLVSPAVLALVCVAVLAFDTPQRVPLAATVVATAGIVVAIGRGYVTLSGDREIASATIDAKQRELERFRAMAEASTDFIAMAEPGGRLVYVNPAGRRLVGLPADLDVRTVTAPELLSSDEGRAWREVRLPALLERGVWQGESSLLDRRTGERIPMTASSFAISDPGSAEPMLLATIQRDVRDRIAAELELHRFNSLVAASGDFIAIAGVDGVVHYVNPAGRAMVGLAADADVTTTTIADYLTEEGLRASVEVEQPAVVAHGHWEGESTLRDLRGGPPTPVAINSFLMRHPDTGEPWLLATVQRDISERIAAERELQQLADDRQVLLGHLVQAQEDERARIAADVHDDSVQALAAVELRLSLLHRELERHRPDLLPTVATLEGHVRGASDRLRHLLFDLESPARRADLVTALEEAAAYVFEGALRWSVTGDRSEELPVATRVTAYRIAKEAMVNVRKHARADHVVVRVQHDSDGVAVSVADDGTGFAPDALQRTPGHLGIPGMQDRVTIAGGRLEFDTELGRGTTARIWLPTGPGPSGQ